MPSRGNPNVPTSVKNRSRSRKAGVKASVKARARPIAARSATTETQTQSGSGVHRGRTLSAKKVRRTERRVGFAKQRKEEALDEVRKAGENGIVEMTDVATLPLSKRQQKLAERADARAEAAVRAAEKEAVKAAE
ncbi:hypothetical protein DFP73DRAFT_452094, partial [Morchella snyderi]